MSDDEHTEVNGLESYGPGDKLDVSESAQPPKDNQPPHDYLRKEIIKAGLACSNMLDELIDESEVFYEYCEAVADKVMLMLENESIL